MRVLFRIRQVVNQDRGKCGLGASCPSCEPRCLICCFKLDTSINRWFIKHGPRSVKDNYKSSMFLRRVYFHPGGADKTSGHSGSLLIGIRIDGTTTPTSENYLNGCIPSGTDTTKILNCMSTPSLHFLYQYGVSNRFYFLHPLYHFASGLGIPSPPGDCRTIAICMA
jgi:hypothetical protein